MKKSIIFHNLALPLGIILCLFSEVFFPLTTAWRSTLFLMALLLIAWLLALPLPMITEETNAPPLPAKPPATASSPDQVIMLILGPYATKWFSQSSASIDLRMSAATAWLLITSPEELEKRLNYFENQQYSTQITAFFPLLPDGHERDEIISNQLDRWIASFSRLNTHSLPCVLAIYARLSNQRPPHNPDAVNWVGAISLANSQAVPLNDALQQLSQQLQHLANIGQHSIQTNVLGQQLLKWLSCSSLYHTLSRLLTTAPLSLQQVILADYGNGFTRHGAWSAWLEKTLAIVPPLGNKLTRLPLPQVTSPSRHNPIIQTVPNNDRPDTPRKRWRILVICGLLLLHLLYHFSNEKQQINDFNQQTSLQYPPDTLSFHQLEKRIEKLNQQRSELSQCASQWYFNHWGLNTCPRQLQRLEKLIDKLLTLPRLSSASRYSLFAPNKAEIKAEMKTEIQSIVQFVNQYQENPIMIVGHSDNSGDANFNMKLSRQRAQTIKNILVKQNVISAEQLIVRGVGATEPLSSNQTPQGREQNRRVELLVLP
jgi:outer membrane protein OmpA-like peptidoglycan-associated protein